MPIPTIEWKNNKVRIVDQRFLPHKLKFIYCGSVKSLWHAIKELKVRGAPAIGIAGAFGVVLGARNSRAKNYKQFKNGMEKTIAYLESSRPTARNLFWALERMKRVIENNENKSPGLIKKKLLEEGGRILNEDKNICRRMALHGSKLIKDKDRILTHCNAGGMATADYGTALGVLFKAKEQGKRILVYADETRPLLQGARITTWELMNAGIDTVLLCDNMAASLMEKGMVDKVVVGADRIARNGDAANKIGTYNLAVLAGYHKIPFYVVAPLSTFDFSLRSGRDIPIEERNHSEVKSIAGRLIAPKNAKAYNPAFDVTPNTLVSAIVTEAGIFRKPYEKVFKKLWMK